MTTLSRQASFGTYSPAAIGWGGINDPKKYPELLTPFSFEGVAFGSMHKLAVPIFTDLLAKLVPKIPGGLVKGTCGCFNPGSVTVGGDRSFHTYAIAIDVNWSANPMYHHGRPTGKHTLPAATSGIAREFGCEWGGDWSYPEDWMHLEIHLSPAECRAYARSRKPAKPAAPKPAPTPPNLLEQIMALDRNSADYKNLVNDIAHAVWANNEGTARVSPWTVLTQTLGAARDAAEQDAPSPKPGA